MEDMLKIIKDALEDKKGSDIKIIDISEVSSIADYFVIATGNNPNQVQALCDNVTEKLGFAGYNHRAIEGYDTATWILLDYNDVIIHIFNQEDRKFYDLERMWKDGKFIEQ